MANAFVMFGKVSAGIPVIESVGSATVAGGATSSAAPAGTSFVRVTGMNGAVYVAVGSAPDASASPRVYIPQGAWADIKCSAGETVDVENA